MTRKPVLVIEDMSADRESISLYGKIYELRSPTELGLREQRRVAQLGKLIGILTDMTEATDDELDEAEFAMRELIKISIVAIEDETIERLSSVDRINISSKFFMQLNASMNVSSSDMDLETTEAIQTEEELDRLIGEKQSPDFTSGMALVTNSGSN